MSCPRHPDGDGPDWCYDCHGFSRNSLVPKLPSLARFMGMVPGERRNAAEARAEALLGMARASDADRIQAWKRTAHQWVEELPRGTVFFADDLVAALGLPDPTAKPASNNVLGAVFGSWSKKGLTVWTGELRKSERVIGHGNLLRVWRKI